MRSALLFTLLLTILLPQSARCEEAKPEKPVLVFNIDFYDMLYWKAIPGIEYSGYRDGYYPEADLRGLIRRAADNGFKIILFRIAVCGRAACPSDVKTPPSEHAQLKATITHYDPLKVAVDAAHEAGVKCYAWITPLDDSGPELGKDKPGRQQSQFSFDHPEYQLKSRDGKDTLYGVYCYGYPEVRKHWLDHIDELLARGVDGIFFSNRTHSNINCKQQEYGFNAPVIARYKELFGADPREPDAYDLKKFSRVQGEFYTQFLREAAERIHAKGKRTMISASWRRNGKIASRLGSLDKGFFDWETWAKDGIVDELVVGGDAATGTDPEHVLPYYEMNADSANPDYFRSRMSQPVPIYRWLTIWSWYWNKKENIDAGSFNGPTVRTMLDKSTEAGLDGLLIHEAFNVVKTRTWDVYREFSKTE